MFIGDGLDLVLITMMEFVHKPINGIDGNNLALITLEIINGF